LKPSCLVLWAAHRLTPLRQPESAEERRKGAENSIGGCGCMGLANHNHPHTQEHYATRQGFGAAPGNPTFSVQMHLIRCRASSFLVGACSSDLFRLSQELSQNSPTECTVDSSPRFPRSSDPGSLFLNILRCCAEPSKSKAILCHTRCFSSCGTIRSKIGQRLVCGSVCRIFETTLLKVLSPRCDTGYISLQTTGVSSQI
jgi:hypothetical protein